MLAEYLSSSSMIMVVVAMIYAVILWQNIALKDRNGASNFRHYMYNAYSIAAMPFIIIPFVYLGVMYGFMVGLFFFILTGLFGKNMATSLGMNGSLLGVNIVLGWVALLAGYVFGVIPVIFIML